MEGSVFWWLSPIRTLTETLRKFADTGFPYQSWTSNNGGNAKRLHMINC